MCFKQGEFQGAIKDILSWFPLWKMQRKEHEQVPGNAETLCGLYPVREGCTGWPACWAWSQELKPGFCSDILETPGREEISFLALSIVIFRMHMKMFSCVRGQIWGLRLKTEKLRLLIGKQEISLSCLEQPIPLLVWWQIAFDWFKVHISTQAVLWTMQS